MHMQKTILKILFKRIFIVNHEFLWIISFLYVVLSISFLDVNALDRKSIETIDKCNKFECHMPVITDPSLKVQLIYQADFNFEPFQVSPVSSMAFLDDDILILNKNNGSVIKLVNSSGIYQSEIIHDVNVANSRERGLLGIAISADKIKNSNHNNNDTRFIYLYYTESKNKDGSDVCHVTYYCDPSTSPLGNRLYRYNLEFNTLENPKLLLDLPAAPAPGHNGGVIRLGPDNNIYVTVGDLVGLLNASSSTMAQNFKDGTNPDGRAGILRVSPDGDKVKDIIGDKYPLNRYYAYGIRNSFGIDFDPVTGYLWDTENGPSYGDEINLVKPGFNSGWNIVQGIWRPVKPVLDDFIAGDESLIPKDLVDFAGKGKYSIPEFIWKNTVGPTGLKFLDSDKLGKKYQNDLFVGSFNMGIIYHFDLNADRTGLDLKGSLVDKIADSNIELDDIILVRGLGGITDIEVGPDGSLYVLSNYVNKSSIFRVTTN
jgi:aldose sugar dehydrogenase